MGPLPITIPINITSKHWKLKVETHMSGNKIFSDLQDIKYGVPQSSILDPILFLVNMNDLPTTLKPALSVYYADDTSLVIKVAKISVIHEIGTSAFVALTKWLTTD